MKRLLAVAALAAVAATAVVDTAEARKRTTGSRNGVVCTIANPCWGGGGRRSRGSETTILQSGGLGIGGGVDLQTMLLLGALGGGAGGGVGLMAAGAGGGLGILPLLLSQQLLAPQVVIEERRGRRGRR